MALTQEIVKAGTRSIPGGNLLLPLAAAGGLAAAAGSGGSKDHEKGVFRVIQKGEVGIRTSLGKPRYTKETRNLDEDERRPQIAEAGLRFGFPGIRPLLIISVQDRSLPLGRIIIDRDDDVQMGVDSAAIWGVTKEIADRCIFRTDTLTTSVGEICQNGIRKAAYEISKETIRSSTLKDDLLDIMHQECDQQLRYYGTDLRGLNLTSFAKTEAQMHKESLAQLAGGYAVNGAIAANKTISSLTNAD